ncbi:MAG: hypothetical protein NVS4B3_07590 [Gemmatimonadaceae bacterium]
MKRSITASTLAAMLVVGVATAGAQAMSASAEPYKEGPVIVVSSLRTLPGQDRNYLKYLFGEYTKLMDAEKAAGLILNYGILTTAPRSPEDPDVYLTVTYANMAALDGLSDRTRPIMEKTLNLTPDQGSAGFAARSAMRRPIGSQIMRVLVPR